MEEELDLEDLLHHIPKLKHVSKMEYLDDRKEYEVQLKKQGKAHSSTNDGYRDMGGHGNESSDGFHQALKFQFVDPGFMPQDNNLSPRGAARDVEGTSTSNSRDQSQSGDGAIHNAEDAVSGDGVVGDRDHNRERDEVKVSYSSKQHSQSSCVSTTFSCHVWYPHQFRALRQRD